MNTTSRRCLMAICGTWILSSAASAWAAVPLPQFTNGGFEVATSYGQFKPGGSTDITGWTTVLSGVEYFDATPYGGSPAGPWVVDLANYTYAGGGIEQVLSTTAGQAYALSFMAGNYSGLGRTGSGIVKVTVDGATTSFDTALATAPAMAWALQTLNFTAASANTTVRFWNDQDANRHFAFIDGVALAVSAVPEPGTAALWWAGLAAGLWLSRRQPALHRR